MGVQRKKESCYHPLQITIINSYPLRTFLNIFPLTKNFKILEPSFKMILIDYGTASMLVPSPSSINSFERFSQYWRYYHFFCSHAHLYLIIFISPDYYYFVWELVGYFI